MVVFYYMYYRLVHFYKRHHEANPLFSAYCALFIIQILTFFLICNILQIIFPAIYTIISWLAFHIYYWVILVMLIFILQWRKYRSMYRILQNRWSIETTEQQCVRKCLLIAYVGIILLCMLLISIV